MEDKILLLEKQNETIREEMHQQFIQIMKIIQQNPQLSKIKPEKLIKKVEQ